MTDNVTCCSRGEKQQYDKGFPENQEKKYMHVKQTRRSFLPRIRVGFTHLMS